MRSEPGLSGRRDLTFTVAIRGAVDQVPPRLARYPDLDVDRYAQELAALFDRATRREPERPEGSQP